MTIQQAYKYVCERLQSHYHVNEAKAIAKRLLLDKYNISNIDLITKSDTDFDNETELEKDVQKLIAFTPVQHITGFEEFMGRNFNVTPKTLIPRPETEELVHLIIQNHKSTTTPLSVLDIGTGTGAIAITLDKELPNTQVTAIDIDPKTLEVATNNAVRNSAKIKFIQADILSYTPSECYDIIVSNPPYVTMTQKEVMHKNVTLHEPDKALYVENNDPLIFYRRITELSLESLKPKGSLYFEINEIFGKETAQLLEQHEFTDVQIIKDFNNKDRIVCGTKK